MQRKRNHGCHVAADGALRTTSLTTEATTIQRLGLHSSQCGPNTQQSGSFVSDEEESVSDEPTMWCPVLVQVHHFLIGSVFCGPMTTNKTTIRYSSSLNESTVERSNYMRRIRSNSSNLGFSGHTHHWVAAHLLPSIDARLYFSAARDLSGAPCFTFLLAVSEFPLPTRERPLPKHSGPEGKSTLCVQGVD